MFSKTKYVHKQSPRSYGAMTETIRLLSPRIQFYKEIFVLLNFSVTFTKPIVALLVNVWV